MQVSRGVEREIGDRRNCKELDKCDGILGMQEENSRPLVAWLLWEDVVWVLLVVPKQPQGYK